MKTIKFTLTSKIGEAPIKKATGWKKHFQVEWGRMWGILGVGYGGYLIVLMLTGFIESNPGKVGGYLAALLWYVLYSMARLWNRIEKKLWAGIIKEQQEILSEQDKLLEEFMDLTKPNKENDRSDKGGIPSPFYHIKRLK